MRVLLIDDEKPCLEELAYLLGKYPDVEILGMYTHSRQALAALESVQPDALFLDMDMPSPNGMELALQIQSLYAGIMIVFVTAYSQYALDSFKAFPLDYLLKPIKEARLDSTIEQMRKQFTLLHPVGELQRDIKIRCFGRFAVMTDHEIKWSTRRVRELFLYLINLCGAAPTKNELVNAVFGGVNDKKTANNMYVTIYKLRSLLESIDPEKKCIDIKEDYSLQIMPGFCDYTDFMSFAGQNAAITEKNAVDAARALNLCTDSYLEDADFAWALDTASFVETEYERIALGLAGFYAGAGHLRETENILNKLLQKNPLAEEGYTRLLELYRQNGSNEAFAAKYEEYAAMLWKELRAKPDVIYREYYSGIKKKTKQEQHNN